MKLTLLALAGAGILACAAPPVPGVRLSWDANTETDLSGYRVHRRAAPGAPPETREAGLVTTFEWVGLSATNHFYVTAVNVLGLESDPSDEVVYVLLPWVYLPLPVVTNYGATRTVLVP